MNLRHSALLIVALVVAGCSSASREEMSRAVLANDPPFQALLAQRDALERQVDDLREELVAKRLATNEQIRALQRAFRETRARLQGQIDALVKQLEPERERLLLEIKTTRLNISTQDAIVQGLKNTLAEIHKSLSRPAPAAPATPPSSPTPPMTPAGATGTPAGAPQPLPPTGQETKTPAASQERDALDARVADMQQQLGQAEAALAEQRTRLRLLQYKLRLLRID